MSEFARSADLERYREIVRRAREDDRKEDKRRKDKKEDDDKERDADEDAALEVMAYASAAELEHFDVTMTHYHDATYQALIENDRLTEMLERERQRMLDEAYVLPDGTRVFESEDGIRVFDEFGNEVDPEVIAADEINDANPKWEEYSGNHDALDQARLDRQAITDYQQKLDDAQQRRDDGDLTSDELKAIEKDLADSMPESVRDQLAPEFRPALNAEVPAPATHPTAQVVKAATAPIHDAPTF